ncbi:MAG: bifunctional alpha/beta hydrolase/OsmC family protein [Hyphomonadaceae bacterium]
MHPSIQKITFEGALGESLAARLDLPAGQVRATAIFAHCFTCSKDIAAARKIASELAMQGFAVLRFDFTGLGHSGGDFANTNFSSNCQDLVAAADWLRENIEAPSLLIGHSLGGAAVLAVAGQIAEVKAVASIGAPADAEHVVQSFAAHVDDIEQRGEAEVTLVGRKFRIKKQFLDDLGMQDLLERVHAMRKPLLILHAPLDQTVGIDNATALFKAARHPKSFVSLDNADHLLTKPADAQYAATVIAAWASRFVEAEPEDPEHTEGPDALAVETGAGKFQNYMVSGPHRQFADEPTEFGGYDSGPSPYDFAAMALAACTSMTLRLYAAKKQLELGRIKVAVSHNKVHARDCDDCTEDQRASPDRIDRFERRISIEGGADAATRAKLVEIANKCPVHRTLEKGALVTTAVDD